MRADSFLHSVASKNSPLHSFVATDSVLVWPVQVSAKRRPFYVRRAARTERLAVQTLQCAETRGFCSVTGADRCCDCGQPARRDMHGHLSMPAAVPRIRSRHSNIYDNMLHRQPRCMAAWPAVCRNANPAAACCVRTSMRLRTRNQNGAGGLSIK